MQQKQNAGNRKCSDADTDKFTDLLLPRRSSDKPAGLQILGHIAGQCGDYAYHAAYRYRRNHSGGPYDAAGFKGESRNDERRYRHARDGIVGTSHQSHHARRNDREEKAEKRNQQRSADAYRDLRDERNEKNDRRHAGRNTFNGDVPGIVSGTRGRNGS